MDVLRWIAVVPAAVVAYIVVKLAFGLAGIVVGFQMGVDTASPWTLILQEGAAVFGSMVAAGTVAPQYKWETILAVGVLWILIAGFSIAAMTQVGFSFRGVSGVIGTIGGAVMAILTGREIAENDKW